MIGRVWGICVLLWVAGLGAAHGQDGGCLAVATEVPTLSQSAPEVPARIDFWVDGSVSMKGFAAGGSGRRGDGDTYRALIGELPRLMLANDLEAHYHIYGANQHGQATRGEIDRQAFVKAATPAFYDQPGFKQGANAADILADTVDLPADQVTVVFTDMFLTQPGDGGGSDPDALIRPLRHLLQKEREVAFVAIASRFDGWVYDLPGGLEVKHTGWRPFFLLIAGGPAQVAWTVDLLEEQSVLLELALHPEELPAYRVIQFGASQLTTSWERPALWVGVDDHEGKGMRERELVPTEEPDAQYVVRRDNQPHARLDLPQGDGASDPKVTARLWALYGVEDLSRHGCQRGEGAPTWLPVDDPDALALLVNEAQGKVTLFADWLRLGFLQSGTLYHLQMEVTGEPSKAVPGWVDAWSIGVLEAEKGAYAEREPFPAVGLEGLIKTLILLENSLSSGAVLDRIDLVFRVE